MWSPLINFVLIFLLFPAANFADKRVCPPIHLSAAEWEMNCSNKNISSVPDFSDHPVVYMNLRNNRFNSSISFTPWKTLKYLDLSLNNLTNIDDSMFEGISELEKLNVSFCSLVHISGSHLRGKTLIKLLDLSGNPLLARSKDFLTVLNGSLDRGSHSIHINSMDLRGFRFPDDFFLYSKHLHYLDLSSNGLQDLPKFSPSLNYLDISNNSFSVLRKEPFLNSAGMLYLIAHNNEQLVEIDEDAFQFMENLAKVSFAGSKKLEYLPNDVFFHNHHLTHLSLVDCNFKTLSSYLEPQLMRLQILELQGNPWKCDKSMQWLAGLNSTTHGLSHVRCADGSMFEEFFSVNKRNMWVYLINIMVVSVFLLFFIGFWFVYELDKKRKAANPYWRLGKANHVNSPVYVTTVA